jgi:hypothetical protein
MTAITAGALFAGFYYTPQPAPVPAAYPQGIVVGLVADHPGVTVSFTSATTNTRAMAFQLDVSTQQRTKVLMYVQGPNFDDANGSGEGWQFLTQPGYPQTAEATWQLPAAGDYTQDMAVGYQDCHCVSYRKPYLVASAVAIDVTATNIETPTGVLDQVPALGKLEQVPSLPGSPSYYPVLSTPIQRNSLDLYDKALPSVFTLDDARPPAPTETQDLTWSWQNSTFGSIRLISPDAKDQSEVSFFVGGLAFGVAGGGLIAMVDSGFDLWQPPTQEGEQDDPESTLDQEEPPPAREAPDEANTAWKSARGPVS